MKILFVSQLRPDDLEFSRNPRGWAALVHFWQVQGADVACAWRDSVSAPHRLVRAVRAFRPDLVVTGWLAAPLVVWLRRRGLIPAPVVHAWDDYYAEQAAWPAWTIRPLERYAVQRADFVTSPSRWNIARAQHWGVPCRYVPHGSDPFPEAPDPDAPRLAGDRILVYSGHQTVYQRTERLIQAVRGLPCDLYLAGPVNPAMRKRAPGNAHFLGLLPQRMMPRLYAQAHVLGHTSDQDSTFKVFEYIRARKPILALAGRVEHLLKHGETAYVTADLREGIKRLFGDAVLRAKLVSGVSAIPSFSWEETAGCHLAIFRRILDQGAVAAASEPAPAGPKKGNGP